MNRLQRVINRLQEVVNRGKRLWRIAATYDADLQRLQWTIDTFHKRLGEHTTIHADIHYKDKDMIIAVGQYRNRDYVRMFYIDPDSFLELIEMLKQIEPNARAGRFDMPPGPPFSAVYEMDRFA